MKEIFNYIDINRERFVQDLLPLISQPSVSTTGEGMLECAQMLKEHMEGISIQTSLLKTDNFPVVVGEVNNPLAEKTLLLLCHYDVVPAGPMYEWQTPPFSPVIKNNRIWGRGAGDAKGQLMAGLKAVQAWKAIKGGLPINLRMIYIGDEETGSPTLVETIELHKDLFQADAVFFSDASTLDVWGPIVFLGNRGVLALELTARGAESAAHSGSYGGLLRNPALRLAHALASMRDADGRITIEGFYDNLRQLGPTEHNLLSKLKIDPVTKLQSLQATEFWGDPGYNYFETQMYRPTLNIHSLTSGYQEDGWMAVVPPTASAKIDINIVPDLNPDDILRKIQIHLKENGFTDVDVKVIATIPNATASSPEDTFLQTVARAQKQVWGVEPIIYPSIGGAGDLVKAFQETAGVKHFLLVPLAQPDLNEHSPKESFDIDWYIKGIKTVAALINEFARS